MMRPLSAAALFLLTVTLLAQGPARVQALKLGESFPEGETENEASSPVKAPIKPGDAQYSSLVTSSNSKIIYDVVTAPDSTQVMNSRLSEKLNTLASKVQSKWGTTTKLRILSAYEEPPSNISLSTTHNEGRAADITINNFAAARLPELGDLAVASGFDYVHYRDAGYIHVSVIPDRCSVQVDLAFALDGSGSVQSKNFAKALSFIRDVTNFFNIGVNKTRIALVVYATRVKTEFDFDDYESRAEIIDHLSKVRYPRGWTNTGGSLDTMRTSIFKEVNGMRPATRAIPRVVVVMSDGRANIGSYPGTASDKLVAAADTSIISMGIGRYVRKSELTRIATSNANVFMLNSFDDMPGFVNAISTVSCDEPAVVPPGDGIDVDVPPGDFVYLKPSCDDVQSNLIVEEFDPTGESNLYVSYTNKNPGPLDNDFADESNDPTKIIDVPRSSADQPVYISVQGGDAGSSVQLDVWNDLFSGNHTYTLTLPESMKAGAEVFAPAPLLNSSFFKDWYPDLAYTLEGDVNGDFSVDANTGVVTLAKDLDHERTSAYSIKVKAQDRNYPCVVGREALNIAVVDENDNAPVINPTTYTATINENAPLGQVLVTIEATDADSGAFGQLVYSLRAGTHPEGLFAVDSSTGQVSVAASLVDLTTLVYTFEVDVSDSAVPALPSPQNPATVTITVERVFDQPPAFDQAAYTFFVAENVVPTNNKLGQLTASDADMGDELVFSIAAADATAAATQGLSVVAATGEVLLLQALNHEVTSKIMFTAVVKDKGGLEATVGVTVTVTDINEPPTSIKLMSPTGSQTEILVPEVSEETTSPVVLGTLVVADPDDGDTHTCQWLPAAGTTPCPAGTATVVASTKQLVVTGSLNFEKLGAECTFDVRCTDRFNNALTREYVLRVLDANEEPFNGQYTGDSQVAEDAAEDTELGLFSASDPDHAETTLTVTLVQPTTGEVKLGPKTCTGGSTASAAGDSPLLCRVPLLVGAAGLDFETRPSLTVKVRFEDAGMLSEEVTRIITVTDTNDAPTDIIYTGASTVAENTALETVLGTFDAVDSDAGQTHTFALTGAAASAGLFSIVGDELRVAAAIDFETIDPKARTLTVVVTDAGVAPAVTGGATFEKEFTITITNVNEAPVMAPASLVAVPEDSAAGFLVGTLLCVDEDAGDAVSYLIETGNDGNRFALDTSTGALTLASQLNFETQSSYALTVVCKDTAGLASSPAQALTVVVTDINEPPSAITVDTTNVVETKGSGDTVLTLSVSDPDNGQTVTCSITSGAADFAFKAGSNREVVLARELDYDVTTSLTLGVTCTDDGSPTPLSSSATFNIGVLNANEALLSFTFVTPTDGTGLVTVPETVPSGTVLARVRAVDSDQDDVITIALADGQDGDGLFAVTGTPSCADTPTAGTACEVDVAIVGSVDVLGGELVYSLLVEASDAAGHKRSLALSVTITSVNNPPTNVLLRNPTDASAPLTVPENAVEGTVVGVLSVSDVDTAQGHTYVLSSSNGDAAFFRVEGSNLVVAQSADYEAQTTQPRVFAITITAVDDGEPPLSASADFGIELTNVNEPPACVLSPNVADIDENKKAGTKLKSLNFECVDPDTPVADLTFVLTDVSDNGAVPFAVEVKGNGKLDVVTTESLDYEAVSQWVVNIATSDGDNSVSTQLTVNVNNKNDNKPKIKLARGFVKIATKTPVGTEVLEVEVEDADLAPGDTPTYELTIKKGNDDDIFGLVGNTLVLLQEPGVALGVDGRRRRALEETVSYLLEIEVKDGGDKDTATLQTEIYVGCPLVDCSLAGFEDYLCDPTATDCVCPLGFEGPTCELNIDDCAGQDCSGNGQCFDGIGEYYCECAEEKVRGKFYPAWTGVDCEVSAKKCPPFASNPCVNGDCIPADDSDTSTPLGFICSCNPGFQGTFCDNLILFSTGSGSSNPLSGETGTIAGAAIGGVAVALLLVLLVVFVVIRRRQRDNDRATVQALKDGTAGDEDETAAGTEHMFTNPAMLASGEVDGADALNPLWCPPEEDGFADFLTLKEHYATGLMVDRVFDEIVAGRELWLQEGLGREQAEAKLRGREPGAFLVRQSETVPGAFVLSVVTKDGQVRHELIVDNEDEGVLQLQIEGLDNPLYGMAGEDDTNDGSQPGFPTMEHLITHYARSSQPGVGFQLSYADPEYEELVARAHQAGFQYSEDKLLRSRSSRRHAGRRNSSRLRASLHRLRDSVRRKQGRAGEAAVTGGYETLTDGNGYLAPDHPGYSVPYVGAGYDEPEAVYARAAGDDYETDSYIVPTGRNGAEYASTEPVYSLGQESDGSVALYTVGNADNYGYDDGYDNTNGKGQVVYESLPGQKKYAVPLYDGGEDQYMDSEYMASEAIYDAPSAEQDDETYDNLEPDTRGFAFGEALYDEGTTAGGAGGAGGAGVAYNKRRQTVFCDDDDDAMLSAANRRNTLFGDEHLIYDTATGDAAGGSGSDTRQSTLRRDEALNMAEAIYAFGDVDEDEEEYMDTQ